MRGTGGALPRQEIRRLLAGQPPLVEGLVNVEEQLQPNGLDLTLRQVALFASPGRLGLTNQDRRLADPAPLAFNGLGELELMSGAYLATFNEIINLPPDLMALGHPRSSLLRCGVAIHNAVWDAGYSGRSQALLLVYNSYGFRIQQNARLLQLVFLRLGAPTESPYTGQFQGENR